jgi:precorrin-3B synthase
LDLCANLPNQGVAIHISGCGKGCAWPMAAPITLVGNAGRYDIVKNGTARDAPLAQGLSLAQARTLLMQETEHFFA